MKKKLLVGVGAVTLAMAMVAPSFAATPAPASKTTAVESTWVHDGVAIHVYSNHKLSAKDMKVFDGNVDQKINKNTINPNVYVTDGSGTTVAGPDYETYDNSVTTTVIQTGVYTVQGYCTYLMSKLGGTAGSVAGAAANVFWNPVHTWLGTHTYSYNSLTVTKAYSNYYGYYQYFDTLTTYTDSSFSTVNNCYYYDTGVTSTN